MAGIWRTLAGMNKTKRLDIRIGPKEYKATVKAAKACDMGVAEYVRDAVKRNNERVELWKTLPKSMSVDEMNYAIKMGLNPNGQP